MFGILIIRKQKYEALHRALRDMTIKYERSQRRYETAKKNWRGFGTEEADNAERPVSTGADPGLTGAA